MGDFYRFTKIIATLGPASYSYEKIKQLLNQGANVFRLNFSHGSHQEHQQFINWIRCAEKDLNTSVAVIGDLQGPKFRLGPVAGEKNFYDAGEIITIVPESTLEKREVLIFPHKEVFHEIEVGSMLLVDDGKVTLEVTEKSPSQLKVKVLTAGNISSGKGVNLPDIKRIGSFLTDKDKADLLFAIKIGVDYLALSFVQSCEDLKETKDFMSQQGVKNIDLIAKIEKPAALQNLKAIIKSSDGILIARGDLGVEASVAKVPFLQKKIIKECRKEGVPVIVATQMLESMTACSKPTRAEVSDVATAVYQGADALLLSAESASGQYPIKAVSMMKDIIVEVEKEMSRDDVSPVKQIESEGSTDDAMAVAVQGIVKAIDVCAILCFSSIDRPSKRVARQRIWSPILGVVFSLQTARKLSLVWGIFPICREDTSENSIHLTCEIQGPYQFIKKGGHVITLKNKATDVANTIDALHIEKVHSFGAIKMEQVTACKS